MYTSKWKLIWSFISAQRLLVSMALLAGIFYNLFTIMIPISIGKFYEFAFGFSSHRLKAFSFIPYMDAADHTAFLLLFFCLVGLRFIFEYGNRYAIALVGEQFAKSFRERLFEAQLQIAMPVYDEKGIGKYLLRFSGDLKSIQNYIKNGVLRFVQDVLLLVIVFAVIAYMNMMLAVIIVGFIGLASLLLWWINKLLYKQSLERRDRRSGMLSFVSTRLRAIASLKIFNKYTPENKRYRKRSEKLYRIGKKYAGTVALMQASIPAITYGLLGSIMVYVLKSPADENRIGGGSLLVVILLILGILPVLRRTLRVSITWKLGSISLKKLIAIFELPKENELPFESLDMGNRTIYFEDVQYSYAGSTKPVFENINMEIPPKTTTHIYGPTGSGKSTFVKLLLKTIAPQKGNVLVDGVMYNKLSEKTIRKNMAVVSNDYPLYGKDVYEAIVYSRNTERKKRAAKLLAHLQRHEQIKDHLNLHDRIGDLGSNLNSGQQKLLQYCRALLTDKPILIVEEPIEYLSPKTGRLILELLSDSQHNKTIIILTQASEFSITFDKKYSLQSNLTIAT